MASLSGSFPQFYSGSALKIKLTKIHKIPGFRRCIELRTMFWNNKKHMQFRMVFRRRIMKNPCCCRTFHGHVCYAWVERPALLYLLWYITGFCRFDGLHATVVALTILLQRLGSIRALWITLGGIKFWSKINSLVILCNLWFLRKTLFGFPVFSRLWMIRESVHCSLKPKILILCHHTFHSICLRFPWAQTFHLPFDFIYILGWEKKIYIILNFTSPKG